MNYNALILLLVFQVKHLIADYYLQFPYMYMNKGKPTGWVKPLTHHSLMHAFFTVFILSWAVLLLQLDLAIWSIILLGVFDFATHFATDRWKAIKKDTPQDPKFWTSLGVDQMIHHIVGIIIVFVATMK